MSGRQHVLTADQTACAAFSFFAWVSGYLISNPTTARKGNEVVGVCNTRFSGGKTVVLKKNGGVASPRWLLPRRSRSSPRGRLGSPSSPPG